MTRPRSCAFTTRVSSSLGRAPGLLSAAPGESRSRRRCPCGECRAAERCRCFPASFETASSRMSRLTSPSRRSKSRSSTREWWIPAVGVDRAVAPGPGKPLTVIDTGVDMTHEEFATRPGTTAPERADDVCPVRGARHGRRLGRGSADQRARHCRRLPAGRAPNLGREPDRRRNHHRRRHPGPGRRHPPRAGRRQPQPRLADQEPRARRDGRGHCRLRDARGGRLGQQPPSAETRSSIRRACPMSSQSARSTKAMRRRSSRAARSTSTFPRPA